MSTREDTVLKIRKLLELSHLDNQHEAELAAARAQELMLYHQIEEAELATVTEVEPVEKGHEIGTTGPQRLIRWKASLANVLAHGFSCRVYYHGATIRAVGRESSVKTVRYLYAYLERELSRLAEDAWKRESVQGVHGKTWKNNFYFGAVAAIGGRLISQKKEILGTLTTESKALIRINSEEKEVNQVYSGMRLGTLGGSYHSYNSSAREQGQQAGQSVSLSSGGKGLGAAPRQLR
jgi:hypothetical protein